LNHVTDTFAADESQPLLTAVHSFQSGDADSFDTIVRIVKRAIFSRARKMHLSVECAEDITQVVLVRIFVHAKKAEFISDGKVWSWILTITVSEVIKHWRKKSPSTFREGTIPANLEPVDEVDTPLQSLASADELSDVQRCIDRLPDANPFLLHTVMQMTFRDAAKAIGLSLGKFKHRYETSLRSIRSCMKKKGHDLE
jgi:RNA polymerase sigma factor (sigma-70 family)